MPTKANIGYGTTLARGDGASPEVFTLLSELIALTPPNMTLDQVEATHMLSPDQFREYINGLRDGGEFTAQMNFITGDTTQNNEPGGLLNDFLQGVRDTKWQIAFPGSPTMTWTFIANVVGYEIDPPIDDRMTLTATFRVSGTIAVT